MGAQDKSYWSLVEKRQTKCSILLFFADRHDKLASVIVSHAIGLLRITFEYVRI